MEHVTEIAGYVGLSNIKTHIVDLESKTDMAKHALMQKSKYTKMRL